MMPLGCNEETCTLGLGCLQDLQSCKSFIHQGIALLIGWPAGPNAAQQLPPPPRLSEKDLKKLRKAQKKELKKAKKKAKKVSKANSG